MRLGVLLGYPMNHFAEAERLLTKADGVVVPSIVRELVRRATVHAQLAQVQAMEDAYGLQPAVVDAEVVEDALTRPGVVDGWPLRTPPVVAVETRTATNDRL